MYIISHADIDHRKVITNRSFDCKMFVEYITIVYISGLTITKSLKLQLLEILIFPVYGIMSGHDRSLVYMSYM